ncbi:MAG: hypothetical protein E6Q97_07130 [Desulfurellales bacterium]|nr:MAG: hypothetical protein E6Q97_07130 [Desulfurellales bacterium]
MRVAIRSKGEHGEFDITNEDGEAITGINAFTISARAGELPRCELSTVLPTLEAFFGCGFDKESISFAKRHMATLKKLIEAAEKEID